MRPALYSGGGGSRPAPPSRADALRVQQHFQGAIIQSRTYGELRWFPAGLGAMMLVGELESTLAQLQALGDTHAQADLFMSYGEPGQQWGTPQTVPNFNIDHDVETYVRLVDGIITFGMRVLFVFPGEGRLGWNWIMSSPEFPALVAALRDGYDRLAYGPVQFGYDGTWPADWTVDMTKQALVRIREVLGSTGMAALMFGRGPAGNQYLFVEDESDYGKPWMQGLDLVIFTGGPDQAVCPAPANVGMYMIGPALRPFGACTPGWSGPFILSPGTPRGPYQFCFGEWAEYEWTHYIGGYTAESIAASRATLRALGFDSWG